MKLRAQFRFWDLVRVPEGRPGWVLSVLLVLGVLVRLPNLDESVWYDELYATHVALASPSAFLDTVLGDVHPPVYSLLMFGWISLFGDSEISIRLPPLILGIASIPLTYILGLKLLRNARAALLSSWLLVVSPVHIWYSQEARSYSAILFLSLLALLAFYELYNGPRSRGWIITYSVSLFLAVFTHYFMVAYVVAFTMIGWLRRDGLKTRITVINLVVLLSLVSYLALRFRLQMLPTDAGSTRDLTGIDLWRLFFDWFLTGNSLWAQSPLGANLKPQDLPVLIVQFLAFGLFLSGALRMATKRHLSWHILVYLASMPLLVWGLGLVGMTRLYVERSMIAALPLFYMVISVGITGMRSRLLASAGWVSVVLFSLTVLAVFCSKGDEWTVYKPNPDWRSATRYIDSRIGDDLESRAVLALTPLRELTYYDAQAVESTSLEAKAHTKMDLVRRWLGDKNPVVGFLTVQMENEVQRREERNAKARLIISYPSGPEEIRKSFAAVGSRRFYVIYNRYWAWDLGRLLAMLRETGEIRPVGQAVFKGLEVFEYDYEPFVPRLTPAPIASR